MSRGWPEWKGKIKEKKPFATFSIWRFCWWVLMMWNLVPPAGVTASLCPLRPGGVWSRAEGRSRPKEWWVWKGPNRTNNVHHYTKYSCIDVFPHVCSAVTEEHGDDTRHHGKTTIVQLKKKKKKNSLLILKSRWLLLSIKCCRLCFNVLHVKVTPEESGGFKYYLVRTSDFFKKKKSFTLQKNKKWPTQQDTKSDKCQCWRTAEREA